MCIGTCTQMHTCIFRTFPDKCFNILLRPSSDFNNSSKINKIRNIFGFMKRGQLDSSFCEFLARDLDWLEFKHVTVSHCSHSLLCNKLTFATILLFLLFLFVLLFFILIFLFYFSEQLPMVRNDTMLSIIDHFSKECMPKSCLFRRSQTQYLVIRPN